jgi:hypothetical protein
VPPGAKYYFQVDTGQSFWTLEEAGIETRVADGATYYFNTLTETSSWGLEEALQGVGGAAMLPAAATSPPPHAARAMHASPTRPDKHCAPPRPRWLFVCCSVQTKARRGSR